MELIQETVQLAKNKIGLTTDSRDDYIEKLIRAAIAELQEVNGIAVDLSSVDMQDFVAAFAEWKYSKKGNEPMPDNLRYRLRNYYASERYQYEAGE